ncbi:hypothetical protein BDR05DRAFT_993076 [Suillus weaverae]|nr:hypothetical protein BDR05DRAFT_993076 [Suillus weaverae]
MFESSSFSHGGHRSFNFPSSGQNFQWGGYLTPSPLSGATPLPEDPFISGNSHGQCIPQPVFHQNYIFKGAYIHDHQQITVLQDRCKMLEMEVVRLTTERDSIKEMFERLASGRLQQTNPLQLNTSHLSISPTNSNRPSPTTHPNVHFWEQVDFLKWYDTPAGQGRNSSHLNMAYLEDKNGHTVSSRTVKAIQRVLRGGWSELVTCKIAPQSWGKLSASGRQLIHIFMENEFPLFKLTNNGWKLDHLATTTYPAWRRNNLDANGYWKSGGNIKKEDDNDDIDNECAESDGEGTNARKCKQVAELAKCEGGKKKRKADPALASTSPAFTSPSPTLASTSPALTSPSPTLISLPLPLACPLSPLTSPPLPLASLSPALTSTLPLIQPIATVDVPHPPNAVSNVDKENIPPESQPIPAPKPVRITIFPAPPSPPAPALECEDKKATVNSNPAEPMSKAKKAKGKMCPSQTRNGHNLCAHHWLKQIKTNGTTDEFGIYYMSLAENQRTAYDKEVTDLVAANKWDKTIGQGRMY